jgi:hypothetical protein
LGLNPNFIPAAQCAPPGTLHHCELMIKVETSSHNVQQQYVLCVVARLVQSSVVLLIHITFYCSALSHHQWLGGSMGGFIGCEVGCMWPCSWGCGCAGGVGESVVGVQVDIVSFGTSWGPLYKRQSLIGWWR